MDLAEELADLQTLLGSFEFRREWLLADLVLLGLCVEAEESAAALAHLLETPFPHRALALVRTAFESAQQGLVLATHENYAEVGARAWVHYQRRVARVLGGEDKHRVAEIFTEKLTSMSEVWRSIHGQAESVIAAARAEVEAHNKQPDNWLGGSFLPRQQKAYEMLSQVLRRPALAKAGEDNRALYAALSLETHAAPRINPREIRVDSTGAIQVRESTRDLSAVRFNARACMAMSVRELVWALNWRAAVAAT